MSTLIDSIKSAGFSQSIPALSAGFYNTSASTAVQAQGLTGNVPVAPSADPGPVPEAKSAGQFMVAFAQALQTATSVDPATGHREMIAGANAQLATTLKSLLVSSGFTNNQAIAATQGFVKKLAQGGDASMSAVYGWTPRTVAAGSQAYSSNSMTANTVATTERSGSVSIGINLNTGKLDVSLASQSTQAYAPPVVIESTGTGDSTGDPSSAAVPLVASEATPYAVQQQSSEAPAATPGTALTVTGVGASAQAVATSTSGTVPANASDDAAPDLTPLISKLSNTTLHGQQNVLNSLLKMSGGAPSATSAVRVGFSQTLAIRQLDAKGYGSTLYKRPDGSTAQMSLEPTHVVV